MNRKTIAHLALVALAVAAAPGCSKRKVKELGTKDGTGEPSGNGGGSSGGTIKIVSSLPQTGSANAQTTTIINGIRMAIDEAGGKAGNFTISYEPLDDASAKKGDWDPEVEAANAGRAAKDPDIMVYIGTYNSGAAKIAIPILNEANLSMISPANTTPGLTKPGKGEPGEPDIYRKSGKITYFRVVPADDIQGKVGAEWMKEMGGQSVFILDDRNVYGKGIADVFEVTANDIGIKVLGREGVDFKAQEYRGLMTKIAEQKPDWIYYGGTTQTNAGQLAKDMVAVGLKAKMMVPDGCYEKAFIEAAGADNANDRVYVTFGGMPPDKLTGKGAEFVARYQKKYNKMPEGYAIYGYVCGQVAMDAIARAGKKDREAIRAAMAATAQQGGVFGDWKFDENGDTTVTTMSGSVVHSGNFQFVKVLGGDAAPAPAPTDGAAKPTEGP